MIKNLKDSKQSRNSITVETLSGEKYYMCDIPTDADDTKGVVFWYSDDLIMIPWSNIKSIRYHSS